ncbi:MAG TPA: hypothetical protein VEL75_06310, partial [Candidatus Methylomirabilis sp.]|nr:hypothetical protein [Candidatus Methylomirabilis sp.]
RMVRIAQQEYIALSGCVPAECSTHRGLLLIRPDGEQLLSRLDDAGLSHYYQLAPAATAASVPQGAIDSAWFAVERVERRG